MRPSEFGPKKCNKRRVIVLRRGMCRNCGTSLTSATRPYFVARIFKPTKPIRELPMSRHS
ncbi:hypothetical protein Gogos_019959 [Gossypium gossypioides]|uniref:Uncharacterized protein n=1 Tax=Gossypium gossypioides TaxID=34282 RepID=A0A7J9D7P6_GOSGO|nr:hypothetical protein [Gossypium gossypioides]